MAFNPKLAGKRIVSISGPGCTVDNPVGAMVRDAIGIQANRPGTIIKAAHWPESLETEVEGIGQVIGAYTLMAAGSTTITFEKVSGATGTCVVEDTILVGVDGNMESAPYTMTAKWIVDSPDEGVDSLVSYTF